MGGGWGSSEPPEPPLDPPLYTGQTVSMRKCDYSD